MVSSQKYLDYVLEQLNGLEEITYRKMMGEYILYYQGKIVGGIYDDRLLVKPVASAITYMKEPVYESIYRCKGNASCKRSGWFFFYKRII